MGKKYKEFWDGLSETEKEKRRRACSDGIIFTMVVLLMIAMFSYWNEKWDKAMDTKLLIASDADIVSTSFVDLVGYAEEKPDAKKYSSVGVLVVDERTGIVYMMDVDTQYQVPLYTDEGELVRVENPEEARELILYLNQ